jgi:hypothetical protein
MTLPSSRRACIRAGALLLTLAAAVACLPAAAQAQATRTWVSGNGDDVNPCSRTAPCKTLAGSISKTAEGGEINAVDPSGYGAVTITKAITIDLSATVGGILNALTTGVIVNAGADDDVVLRGLDIDGGGVVDPTCVYNGVNGIRLLNARTLRVEDVSITRQDTDAVQLAPTASDPTVVLDDVDISHNCVNGINAAPAAGRTVDVLVRGGTTSNSGTAIRAADGAHVRLTGATIFGNAFGLVTVGTGVIDSCGDNTVIGNGPAAAPTNGVATAVDCDPGVAPTPPPAPAAAAVAPPPPPPAAKAATIVCTVPRLVGLTLAKAKLKLAKANCTLGKTTRRATSRSTRVGRVLSQGSTAGRTRPQGAKVAVTVGKRSRAS